MFSDNEISCVQSSLFSTALCKDFPLKTTFSSNPTPLYVVCLVMIGFKYHQLEIFYLSSVIEKYTFNAASKKSVCII